MARLAHNHPDSTMETGAHLRRGVTPDQWADRTPWSAVLTDNVTQEWALHESDDAPDQWTLRPDGDDDLEPETVAVTDGDTLKWTAGYEPEWWPSYVPGDRLDKLTAYCALRGRHRRDASMIVPGLDDDPRRWEWFWDSHDRLAIVRDWADCRMANRWAVLLCTVALATAHVPPSFTLGGEGTRFPRSSLNLFGMAVGTPGAGKGAAVSAAETLLVSPTRFEDVAQVTSTGTAEGMARLLETRLPDDSDDGDQDGDDGKKKGASTEPVAPQYLFRSDELSKLLAEGGRKGDRSTMGSYLTSMWIGESLGTHLADSSRSRNVPAYSYRACLFAAAQPVYADELLAETQIGLAQRFVLAPARAVDEHMDRGDDIDPETLPHIQLTAEGTGLRPAAMTTAQFGAVVTGTYSNGTTDRRDQVPQDPEVTAELVARLKARRRSDAPDVNQHRDLSQLKLAAGLSVLLHDRLEVSRESWELAGDLMDVSDATARDTTTTARQQRRDASVNALAEGMETKELAARQVNRKRLDDMVDRLVNYVEVHGETLWSDLRNRQRHEHRDLFDTAVEMAVEDGRVTVRTAERHNSNTPARWVVPVA
ncbi:hypothetical protein [Corynebacterium glyciniphilum]|uniref:hypothetical protein n=1 Tax=Corynebacterium glyciniphilum TaxID=1404244 RepID=UPI003FD0E803